MDPKQVTNLKTQELSSLTQGSVLQAHWGGGNAL
jgi:hypothetical protein